MAEPPKKRKRIDPALLRLRIERKMRKLEREIAKIEKEPRHPVPIAEYQPNKATIKDLSSRPSHYMQEFGINQSTIRAASQLWTIYRLDQTKMENYSYQRVSEAQNHALQTLKEIDESLYNKTVEVDDLTLLPYSSSHVRKELPPNPSYTPPDGYIKDLTEPKVIKD